MSKSSARVSVVVGAKVDREVVRSRANYIHHFLEGYTADGYDPAKYSSCGSPVTDMDIMNRVFNANVDNGPVLRSLIPLGQKSPELYIIERIPTQFDPIEDFVIEGLGIERFLEDWDLEHEDRWFYSYYSLLQGLEEGDPVPPITVHIVNDYGNVFAKKPPVWHLGNGKKWYMSQIGSNESFSEYVRRWRYVRDLYPDDREPRIIIE